MTNNYQNFKTIETEKSLQLAKALSVSTQESKEINKCFDFLLENHQAFNIFDGQMNEVPDADKKRVELENSLQEKFDHLPSLSQVAEVYILAKCMCYYNIVQTDYLKGSYIETIFALPLAKLFTQKSSIIIDIIQMLLITDYLKESPKVGDNGGLLDDLLELIKKNALQKQWTTEQEVHLLKNLLDIHQKTNYYSNLKCLKEIFKYVHSKSESSLLNAISNYKSENRQGGMQMLEIILHTTFSNDIYRDFEIKKEWTILLDGLSGKNPKPTWVKKWKNIRESIDNNTLENILSQIEALKHYKILHLTENGKETAYGVTDDIATSILKGVEWIRQNIAGTLTINTPKPKVETPEERKKKIQEQLQNLYNQKNNGDIDLKTYLLQKKELEKLL
ncbi:hypothetical protein [Capnocytophaga sputigena]|uniref:hypothetical protein n=1 Tax=Capnocytophaga sputigena TaxID=1019 RepID=UPI0028F042B3|nr:hypothetical protein [Capnocytophaga sputigena]